MRVLVAGVGRSGVAAANHMVAKGHTVVITDAKPLAMLGRYIPQLKSGIELALGGHGSVMEREFDLLVTSPGIPWDSELLSKFRKDGTEVISELELAFREYDRRWIAITGTNGKSTTTALVGQMMQQCNAPVVLCGNIGNAAIGEQGLQQQNAIVVAEVSSFQLEGVHSFAPEVSAILNITPDHLDRHGDMENYFHLKKRIFEKQNKDGICVLNMDDPTLASIADELPCKLFGFSLNRLIANGAFFHDGAIYASIDGKETEVCKQQDMKLIGAANIENGTAATAIALAAGAEVSHIRDALTTFAGLPHRMELVAEQNGITYINDSKATNVYSAMKAVDGFAGNMAVILGGRDKNSNYAPLAQLIKKRAAGVILIGEAADVIAKEFADYSRVVKAADLQDAVTKGKQMVRGGGTVLLSPACASFDMFKSYEHRGKSFCQIVMGVNHG